MNLSRGEKLIASKLMREKGYMPKQIAEILRTSIDTISQMLVREKWPVPREDVPVEIGAPVPDSKPFMSRAEVRRVAGT